VLAEVSSRSPRLIPVLTLGAPFGESYSGVALDDGYVNEFGEYRLMLPLVTEWSSIPYSVPYRAGGLQPVEASVKLRDVTEATPIGVLPNYLGRKFSSYNCRRATATIEWVPTTGAYDPTTAQRIFTGVLDRWSFSRGVWTLYLRTDDRPLQGRIPALPAFAKQAWPNIPQSSVGIYPQIVYGEWNSSAVTGQGALKCPFVDYAAGVSSWAYMSYGRIVGASACYVNDVSRGAIGGNWGQAHVFRDGRWHTIVVFTSSFPNPATDRVTVDCKGLTSIWDGTGTLLTNPVEVLKHILANLVYASWNGGTYNPDSVAPLDTTTLASLSTFAVQRLYEATRKIGGTTKQETALSIVESWLSAHKAFRLYWNMGGKLAGGTITPIYPGYWNGNEPQLVRPEDDMTPGTSLERFQDVQSVASQISGSYLPDDSKGQLSASLDVQDPSITPKIVQSLQHDWSAARLT